MKSVLTEYTDISAISGKPAECKHHLVFGKGMRNLADEQGLWMPLTNEEHNCSPRGIAHQIHDNSSAEALSKMLGQVAFEKEWYRKKLESLIDMDGDPAREQFRRIFGISYL